MCIHINIRLRFFLSWVCMFVVLLFPLSMILLRFLSDAYWQLFSPFPPSSKGGDRGDFKRAEGEAL